MNKHQLLHHLRCMLNKIEKDTSIIVSPPINTEHYPDNIFVVPISIDHLCPYPQKFSDASTDIKMIINFISSVIHSIFMNSSTTRDKIQVFIETVTSDKDSTTTEEDEDDKYISETEAKITQSCSNPNFKWNHPDHRPYSRKGFFKRGQTVRRYRLWVFYSDDVSELIDKHVKLILETNSKQSSYVYNARKTTTSPSNVPFITDKIRLFETARKIIYDDIVDCISDDYQVDYDTLHLNKLFSVKHEMQVSNDNLNNYISVDKHRQWHFKNPSNVIELDICNIKLDFIINMYLPDYQAEIVGIEYFILYSVIKKLISTIDAAVPENRMYFGEYIKSLNDDYEELGRFSDIVHQALDLLDQSSVDHLRKVFDMYLINKITYISMSFSSNVSEVGRAVTNYLHKTMFSFHTDRMNGNTLPIYDRSLGIFSNFMIWFMNMCEQYLVLATSHWSFCKCFFGTMDSFRVDHNSLHFNSFMVGEPQSGKSFIFQRLKEMSFEGSIVEFSQWSKNALTTTSKLHDLVIVFHEAPSELFCTAPNGRSKPTEPWINVLKDMLTRSAVSFYYNAGIDTNTGERISNMIEKSVYTSLNLVTNESPKNVELALITRFLLDYSTTGSRPAKSVCNLNASFKNFMTEEDHLILAYLKNFSSHLRVKAFLVFKLVHAILLPEVKCFVTEYIISELDKRLANRNMRTIDIRSRAKIIIFAKIYTIINGLIHLYELETSKYANVPFKMKQLLDMRPFMEDSEEIAVFTIGFLTRTIYDPIEQIILVILGNIHRNLLVNNQMKAFKTTGSSDFNRSFNNNRGAARSSFNIMSDINENDTDHYDPNWLYFPMSKNTLVKEICNNYPAGMAGKPPETQVAIILDNLNQRHIWVNNYKFVHMSVQTPRLEKVDRCRESRSNNIDFREYATFIHTSLLYGNNCNTEDLHTKFLNFKKNLMVEDNNLVRDFVKDIMGYDVSTAKKMLYGEIESCKYPYIFSIIDIHPNPDNKLILSNSWFSGAKINDTNQPITKIFDVNLDTCARYELLRTLYPHKKYKPIMTVDSIKEVIDNDKSGDLKRSLVAMDPKKIVNKTYCQLPPNKFMCLKYGKDSIHREMLVNIVLMLHDDNKIVMIMNKYKNIESMSEKEFDIIFKFIQTIDESITDEDVSEALVLFYKNQTNK